ncbi:MAG: GGDEF-domain containing protein [Alphaproteobacteria bacterium]|nr:MAG: GGDEF-domain containing protein [Alphaproteobacteria bacterium]
MARDISEPFPVQGQIGWLHRAIEAAGDIVYEWDLASDQVTWIGRVADVFGGEAMLPRTGDAFNARLNPEDLPVRLEALGDHLSHSQPYDCEFRVRGENGSFCWVHDRGAAECGPDGAPLRMMGSLRLVTARKQNEARLERLASYDELTGHFNKMRLRDALEHALAYSGRYSSGGAYLVVGLDKLAMLNNTYGYEAGDSALIAVGQRLDRCLRSSDVIGRIGADRFGVVLSRCSEEQMARAAERILEAVREEPVDAGDTRLHVTVSVGGIMFPPFAGTAYDVMAKAETALKEAKREGRDCFVAYRVSHQQELLHRRSQNIGEQVQRAMRDDRLCFAYQPVVTASDHRTSFYEALLRMRDEKGELIPAGAFVPVVEQLGLMRLVDRHVLDLAVRELDAHPEVSLAINISGLTATDQSWLRAMLAQLKGKPEVARRLIVEITETAALHDIEESARFVSALRDVGCRVAVDDFGAGFTSFRHLRSLTVDIVKIDGSFVRNLADNLDNQLFVRNLLGLADAFGLETVAECVETQEDAGFLVGEGVKYLQGYYFGRPSLDRPWTASKAPVVPLRVIADRLAGMAR